LGGRRTDLTRTAPDSHCLPRGRGALPGDGGTYLSNGLAELCAGYSSTPPAGRACAGPRGVGKLHAGRGPRSRAHSLRYSATVRALGAGLATGDLRDRGRLSTTEVCGTISIRGRGDCLRRLEESGPWSTCGASSQHRLFCHRHPLSPTQLTTEALDYATNAQSSLHAEDVILRGAA